MYKLKALFGFKVIGKNVHEVEGNLFKIYF